MARYVNCIIHIFTLPLTMSECDKITMFLRRIYARGRESSLVESCEVPKLSLVVPGTLDIFGPTAIPSRSVLGAGETTKCGGDKMWRPRGRTAQACYSGAVMMHDPYNQ